MQSSLTCQFEHSGKVRSGLIGNFYFHCYQVRPHFLCAALMSSKRTKQHAVRRLSYIAYIYAVCVMQSSLTCQFEHSGKVRSGLIGNFYFHCYQVRPHFLCAALMSSKRTKQHAVRRLSYIAYIYAVCVMQSSLTCQFEHSGKVRSGLIGNFYFHWYQVRPHFLCAALTSPQRTKQFCPQIEYIYIYIRCCTVYGFHHTVLLLPVKEAVLRLFLFFLRISYSMSYNSTIKSWEKAVISRVCYTLYHHRHQIPPHSENSEKFGLPRLVLSPMVSFPGFTGILRLPALSSSS